MEVGGSFQKLAQYESLESLYYMILFHYIIILLNYKITLLHYNILKYFHLLILLERNFLKSHFIYCPNPLKKCYPERLLQNFVRVLTSSSICSGCWVRFPLDWSCITCVLIYLLHGIVINGVCSV